MSSYQNHQPAISRGLIWGGIHLATTLTLYIAGMMGNPAGNILLFFFGLYMMYQSAVDRRNAMSGYITWKHALVPAWVTALIANLISVPFTWIMVKFIAPEIQDEQRAEAIKMAERMRSWVGDEGFEAQLEKIETQDFAAPIQYVMVFLGAAVTYFLIACIIALIVRRNDPSDPFSKYN